MTLRGLNGISETAGIHTTVLYRYWAGGDAKDLMKKGIIPEDGGYNLAFWLEPSKGHGKHDFYTIDRIKQVAADEAGIAGKGLFFNYKLNEKAGGLVGPDQQYINNVYMYKIKPGYNPYSLSLSDFTTDGENVADYGGNRNRKIIWSSNPNFSKFYYEDGKNYNKKRRTVSNEIEDMLNKGYCKNTVEFYKQEIHNYKKQLKFNFLENKDIEWLLAKEATGSDNWFYKTNTSCFRNPNINNQQKSLEFENIITKDWHASQMLHMYHGSNKYHHHWNQEFTLGNVVGLNWWKLAAPDSNVVVNKKGDPMTYYGTLGNSVKINLKENTEVRPFFPAVIEDGWYYGFIVPTAVDRYYTEKIWTVYAPYHTPIDYGENVELSINTEPYTYGIEYDAKGGELKDVDAAKYETNDKTKTVREKERHNVEDSPKFKLPEKAPVRKGHRFAGWTLEQTGTDGKKIKTYTDKENNILYFKPGEEVKLNDRILGLYKINKDTGEVHDSGYASPEESYATGVPTERDSQKLRFVANWVKTTDTDWDVPYKIIVKKQNTDTKGEPEIEENQYESNSELGYGANGSKIIGMGAFKPKDVPERGYYYYLNKDKSKDKLKLDKDNPEKNKIIYYYNLANTVGIEINASGDYLGDNMMFPVVLSYGDKQGTGVTDTVACRYLIEKKDLSKCYSIKPFGLDEDVSTDCKLGKIKFVEGQCKGIYDEEGKLIPGTENGKINLYNGNKILVDQFEIGKNKLIVKVDDLQGVKPQIYETETNAEVTLDKNNSFGNIVKQDMLYKLNYDFKEIPVTGILDNVSPYTPIAIAVAVLSAYGAYVIITNRKKSLE